MDIKCDMCGVDIGVPEGVADVFLTCPACGSEMYVEPDAGANSVDAKPEDLASKTYLDLAEKIAEEKTENNFVKWKLTEKMNFGSVLFQVGAAPSLIYGVWSIYRGFAANVDGVENEALRNNMMLDSHSQVAFGLGFVVFAIVFYLVGMQLEKLYVCSRCGVELNCHNEIEICPGCKGVIKQNLKEAVES